MSVVEIVRLRPATGVTKAEFLAASDRSEQDHMTTRTGFQRRTPLRGEGGDWTVLVDGESVADALASMDAFPTDTASTRAPVEGRRTRPASRLRLRLASRRGPS